MKKKNLIIKYVFQNDICNGALIILMLHKMFKQNVTRLIWDTNIFYFIFKMFNLCYLYAWICDIYGLD